MREFFKIKTCKDNFEILILNFTVLLFIFRTAIPFFKYPFILIYSGFILHSLITYRNSIKSGIKETILSYRVIIIVIIYLLLSIAFSNKFYLVTFFLFILMIAKGKVTTLLDNLILLPRGEKSLKHYEEKRFSAIKVLKKSLCQNKMFKDCDLFIGAEGAITREDATVNIPKISIYQVELLSVDKYLIKRGLMIHEKELTLS